MVMGVDDDYYDADDDADGEYIRFALLLLMMMTSLYLLLATMLVFVYYGDDYNDNGTVFGLCCW